MELQEMFLLVRWQVSGLGIIGFVGASHLSLVIWKGLKSGVCGGCNPALMVQKKFETTLKKLFPLGGARLGCQLCLSQGMTAKRASGRQWGMSWGVLALLGFSGLMDAWVPLGDACPQPLSILVAVGSDGKTRL